MDLPDPVHMRPQFMRKREKDFLRSARQLAEFHLGDAAADAWTLDPESQKIGVWTKEIARLRDKSAAVREERLRIQGALERAATRPATHLTVDASGARPGEPLCLYVRALRRMLLELAVPSDVVHRIIDTGRGDVNSGVKGKACGKGKRTW